MDEVVKIRGDATSSANKRGREAKLLESRTRLLKDELYSLRRKESPGCDMKLVGRQVADARGEVNNLVHGLRRDTFDL